MKFSKNIVIAFVAIVVINSINASEATRQRKATSAKNRQGRKDQGRKPVRRQSATDKDQDEYVESTMQLSCTLYEEKMFKALSDRGYNIDTLCRIIDQIVRGNSTIQHATKIIKEYPNELDRLSPIFSNVIIDYFTASKDRGQYLSKVKKDAIQMCVNKSVTTIKNQLKQGKLRLPAVHY